MWDDEINKKIKEAADQYHPAYDEAAWNKMEQLLDEHLPQKKGRRRIFYFLFLTVMICGGLFFTLYTGRKNESQEVTPRKVSTYTTNVEQKEKAGLQQNEQSQKKQSKKIIDKYKQDETISAVAENSPSNEKKYSAPVKTVFSAITDHENLKNNKSDSRVFGDSKTNNHEKPEGLETSQSRDLDKSDGEVSSFTPEITAQDFALHSKKDSLATKSIAENEHVEKSKSQKHTSNAPGKFDRNFGITLSIGPDVSGVSLSRVGELTVSYGAGLMYDLSSRFTLRTGFYISKKIYSVGKNEYNAPPGNPGNYNYLQSIDANCKVYEIPLLINYNFSKVKNHGWFASAGLSSYLMKKESYVYHYKSPTGNLYDKSWSIANKNKHYFSVLDVSGGYEYAISKKLILMAEPYLRFPLSGIGAGKIKLNSGGMLFTATLKAFKK